MFERFSKAARAAVVDAQQAARETGTRAVDTRHLVVSLVRAHEGVRAAVTAAGADPDAVVAHILAALRGGGLDADALAAVGIDLAEVRRRTDLVFGEGALDGAARSRGHLPFARDAKKALELALREAIRLEVRGIDGEHLLLGILRADGPGRAALADAGVDPTDLRAVVEGDGAPGSRSA